MSAEYAIEIAASMPAGEATTAQLDQMIQGLTGAGKGADFFQVAMKQVSASLDAAKAASAAASASLSEGNAQYRELEKAANLAAKAVEKAGAKGAIDPSLVADAARADAALQGYAHTLRSLEQNAAAATKSEATFATQLENVRKLSSHVDKTLAGSAEATEKLRSGLASVPGPIGQIGSSLLAPVQGFQKLSAQMGSANAAMLLGVTAAAAVAVAIVAVGVAAIAAAAKVAAWAVGLADANRNAALSQEAVNALHPEIAALSGSYAALTAETGQSAAKLNELAKQLLAAKVSAAEMPAALRAAATAETALAGNGGASQFLEDIKACKGAVGELAAETQAKFGGVVAKQMLGLDAQSARLKKSVSEIFGSLDIDSVLGGVQTLVGLFDKSSASGQAMKMIFESVFQPLINQAQNAAYVIEAFVLGFLIGLTKLYIAVKPAIKAVSEFLGFKDTSLTDTLDFAKEAGELIAPVFVGIVGIFGLLAVAVGVAIAPFVLMSAAAYALVGALVAVGAAVLGGFMSAWQSVKDFFAGLDLAQIGSDMIAGLAAGITGAAGAVLSAITGVVGDAVGAAKSLLRIHSPSKVFAEIGGYTGEGFAQGVEDSAPDAQAAMTDMVDPAPATAAKASASAPAGGSSSGGKPTVHIESLYMAGAKASKAETLSLSEALTRLIQGDAAALGADPEPA